MLKEGEPVPEIYTDPAFSRSSHWELSTSQLSSPFVDGWGYGEGETFVLYLLLSMDAFPHGFEFAVVPDGYGLSYSIGDEYIRWTITSLRKDTKQLKYYLAEAATETRQVMERAAAAEAKKKAAAGGAEAKPKL